MTDRGKDNIDRDWNVWKQAAEIIERERELWRYAPVADELADVKVKLIQLGYLTPAARRRILDAIDKAEQDS